MSHPDAEFLKKYLAPLKGGIIKSVQVKEENDYGMTHAWPVLVVQTKTDKFELEISRDEEGNGPGFIFGLPLPS